MVRIVYGTNSQWYERSMDEWSMARMVYTWYEKSVVRIVNGTKSPDTVYVCRLAQHHCILQ